MPSKRPGRKTPTEDERERAARLGRAILGARAARDFTRLELTKLTSLDLATVQRLERGKTVEPGFFTVGQVARALRIEMDALLHEAEGAD